MMAKYQSIRGRIEVKFERKMEQCITEQKKKQEKIRAAELQKCLKLEEKIRKKLQKAEKAELKERQRQEAKDKKEAKRLERKRAREERERARIQRPLFCFWPSGPQIAI